MKMHGSWMAIVGALAVPLVCVGCGGQAEEESSVGAELSSQFYQCPLEFSNSCDDASVCESTCMGQIQQGGTCTVRGYAGSPTTVSCWPTQITSGNLYFMIGTSGNTGFQSYGCSSMSHCESTCMGQLSTNDSCEFSTEGGYSGGGARPLPVQSVSGTTQALYSCPVHPSENCADTSSCQSDCIGQVGTINTCWWHSSGGQANHISCTYLGQFALAAPRIPTPRR